jgi:class 3 adenylate cyclase
MASELSKWDTLVVAVLPSGTVTFLFTDLEGSMRLSEEHPDAMRGVLVRHDEFVRGEIAGHGAVVCRRWVTVWRAGSPRRWLRVAAAVDAQRRLGNERWGDWHRRCHQRLGPRCPRESGREL